MTVSEKSDILLKDFNILYTNLGLTVNKESVITIRFVITTPNHKDVSNNIIQVENEVEYLDVIKDFIGKLKPLNIDYTIEDVRIFKKMKSYVFIQLVM